MIQLIAVIPLLLAFVPSSAIPLVPQLEADLTVDNRCDFPVTVTVVLSTAGVEFRRSLGILRPRQKRTFVRVLPFGRNEVVYAIDADMSNNVYTQVYLVSNPGGGQQARSRTTELTPGLFGNPQLPPGRPIPAPAPAPAAEFVIDGDWRLSDGVEIQIQGTTGTYLDPKGNAVAGFTKGEVGFDQLASKSETTYTGRVKWRFTNNARPIEWRPIEFTIMGPDTMKDTHGVVWTRIKRRPPT